MKETIDDCAYLFIFDSYSQFFFKIQEFLDALFQF